MHFRNENKIRPNEGKERIGWGGRIRTFTIHINSVVSYRLDHAPAAVRPTDGQTD